MGIQAELKVGPSGSFTVAVDGAIVAEKSMLGFPSEQEIAAAVAKAVGAGEGAR
ncbi:MAG: hypothetical protein NVS2B9_18030 [Myxococcales bacterium]